MSSFLSALNDNPFILTDGGLETRIKYETDIALPKDIEAAGLLLDRKGKNILMYLYNEYLDIAQQYQLPIILGTPTFRANPHRANKAKVSFNDLIIKSVDFHLELKEHRGQYRDNIFISGVIGPMNDAFDPKLALTSDAAYQYHKEQVKTFKTTMVDFLYAGTFPSLNEALGICMAMADEGMTYVISFVLNGNGDILDGCSLNDAIECIDTKASNRPLFYSINCTHPAVAMKALSKVYTKKRVLGIKANASSKSVQELSALTYLDEGDPKNFALQLLEINKKFGLKVLGGCCGTGKQHLNELAKLMGRLSIKQL